MADQPGMIASCKDLYGGQEDDRGRFQWQTEKPKDIGKVVEDNESAKWALIPRWVKAYNDPKRVLSLHSIVVQSPLLKELLGGVLKDYPGVNVNLSRLEFSGRFEPLVHRWSQLSKAINDLKQQQQQANGAADIDLANRIEHAQLLEDLLLKEFSDILMGMYEMKMHGVITYELLWALFQPASIIYAKIDNQDRALSLVKGVYGVDEYKQPVFMLTCRYVDFDGIRFGSQQTSLNIPAFEGTPPICGLRAFPLEYHNSRDEVRTKLIDRGREVEGFAGSHYRNYNGVGWSMNRMGKKEQTAVKGRIIIDTFGYNRNNPMQAVYVTPLHVNSEAKDAAAGYNVAGMPADGFFDDERSSATRSPLSDDDKLLINPLVRGFSVEEKIWLNFFVNSVQDITFSDGAFRALVLPKNQKDLILGFATTKQDSGSTFDDVVEGKGRGMIILLCGPPGVGKTLTAESVAEEMKVPLYMLAAGDLGIDSRTIESKLRAVLDMCTRWNAILLIDEADVFLEQRDLHQLERNKIVSIFLRVLEYYQGTMFLTTNRVQTIDTAFQSRIHISLAYPELDTKARKAIWKTFLAKHDESVSSAPFASGARPPAVNGQGASSKSAEAPEPAGNGPLRHAITEEDLQKLAQRKLNGREIKNVLKVAQMIASLRKEALAYGHVEDAMETQYLHNAAQASNQSQHSIFT